MLAYLGKKAKLSVTGAAKTRNYATQTSSKPALVWQHSHASSTVQQQVTLPQEQHGVPPKLIAKMRRLREEAPATFTARRLSANFHLPKKVVNSVAPYVRHGKAGHNALIAARREKRVPESPELKKARLSAWWTKQFENIQVHRERRHLYRTRGSRCMAEIDVELLKSSDERDYHADMIAENARNKKRKAMAANRRRR